MAKLSRAHFWIRRTICRRRPHFCRHCRHRPISLAPRLSSLTHLALRGRRWAYWPRWSCLAVYPHCRGSRLLSRNSLKIRPMPSVRRTNYFAGFPCDWTGVDQVTGSNRVECAPSSQRRCVWEFDIVRHLHGREKAFLDTLVGCEEPRLGRLIMHRTSKRLEAYKVRLGATQQDFFRDCACGQMRDWVLAIHDVLHSETLVLYRIGSLWQTCARVKGWYRGTVRPAHLRRRRKVSSSVHTPFCPRCRL